MPTAQQITDFETSVAKLNADVSQVSVSQAALDKSTTAAANAQADVTTKTTAVETITATLQADLDDINVKGAAMGLKVNVPAVAGAAVAPPPG